MKKLAKGVSILLTALLLSGIFAIFPAYATTTVYMVPDSNTFTTENTSVGDTFTVTVWVSDVDDLYTWQVHFEVDDTLLNITEAFVDTSDPDYVFYGEGTAPNYAYKDLDTDGYYEIVEVGDSLIGAVPGKTGTFKLVDITMQIILGPGIGETLSCDLIVDDPETFLLNSGLGDISCTKDNGYYEYAWAPPTYNPHLAVVPDYKEFGPYYDWNCTYFTVEVYIMNLAAGWSLKNCSFNLSYNSTLTEVLDVTIAAEWTVSSFAVDSAKIHIEVSDYATPPPSGDVLVATIEFNITGQGAAPPRPPMSYDDSELVFSNNVMYNTADLEVTQEAPQDGLVRVYCKLALPLAWLEVVPSETVLGPELVVGDQYGKEFTVCVDIKGLHKGWNVIGIQFRLSYDPDIVEVVSIEEGDYLAQFPNYELGPPYTYFIAYDNPTDPLYGPHVIVGDLLLPHENGTWTNIPGGEWIPPAPIPAEANGTVACITFRPLKQSWIENITSAFNLIEVLLVDTNAGEVASDVPQNGTLTILQIGPSGRRIDAWFIDYPSPYGGQGLMEPADLVVPQQLLCLTAKVTYNWWPVSQKLVKFHIYDNQGNERANLQNVTGDDGHAYVCFRMPWPNENPEDLLGVWTINVTVSVADVTIYDTITFHYDWLVRIWKVTTDKEEYMHLETVTITVEYGTHAQQYHNVTLTATMLDELLVPVGYAELEVTIGGATYCEYTNYTDSLTITIPYYAYAGKATIYIHFVDVPGGVAITPEAKKEIYILPL